MSCFFTFQCLLMIRRCNYNELRLHYEMLFSLNIQCNNVFTSCNCSNVLRNAAIIADRYTEYYFNKY